MNPLSVLLNLKTNKKSARPVAAGRAEKSGDTMTTTNGFIVSPFLIQ